VEPGSILHWVVVYCPAGRRAALGALLAVRAELRASLRRELDHGVAHLRLGWWQQEAERCLQGQPNHPLTQQICQSLLRDGLPLPDFRPMIGATLLALANAPVDAANVSTDFCAGVLGQPFALAATLLGAPQDSWPVMRSLGSQLAAFELGVQTAPAGAPGESSSRRAELRSTLQLLNPAWQPALRPLLVWAALALRRQQQTPLLAAEYSHPDWRHTMAESLVAWRAARAADHGRFHSFKV
jgi:hypothetical protein